MIKDFKIFSFLFVCWRGKAYARNKAKTLKNQHKDNYKKGCFFHFTILLKTVVETMKAPIVNKLKTQFFTKTCVTILTQRVINCNKFKIKLICIYYRILKRFTKERKLIWMYCFSNLPIRQQINSRKHYKSSKNPK